MIESHNVIKFWARKPISLILSEFPKKAYIIADPFCGSGTTGFAALIRRVNCIYLSDISPVSVFITSTLLSQSKLLEEIFSYFVDFCKDLEEELYRVRDYKVGYAVWMTELECPKCGYKFGVRKMSNEVKCRKCYTKFPTRYFLFKEKLLWIYVEKNGKKFKIADKKILEEYIGKEENLCLKYWYPSGTFEYSNLKIEFRNGPHRRLEIKEIFTRRNLYAVSKIYNEIERIWKSDQEQGDLLKLAFIASLVNATKMIPHAKSSGPSWKLPRYWIPNIREERNFCKSFIRRLKIIKDFKEKLEMNLPISDYKINVTYGDINALSSNGNNDEKTINIFRGDAREAYLFLPRCDFVILDPPHYDQVDYYELCYLWQKWLQGSHNDMRFEDFEYWKNVISINSRIGHDLNFYNNNISRIVLCYAGTLTKHGKLVLILHNKDPAILNETVKSIKEKLHDFKVKSSCEWPQVPSSAQGIHGRKKFLYILKIYRG